jgi:hypothetical protein
MMLACIIIAGCTSRAADNAVYAPADDSLMAAGYLSGSDYLRSCQSISTTVGGAVSVKGDRSAAGICVGFTMGFSSGMAVFGGGNLNGIVCVPPGSTGSIEQTIRRTVAYYQQHPERRDEPAEQGIIAAFVNAYPCPK